MQMFGPPNKNKVIMDHKRSIVYVLFSAWMKYDYPLGNFVPNRL